MGERKLQELQRGRTACLRLSACDHQLFPRTSMAMATLPRSTSDTPIAKRALIQKRRNRAQLWQAAADSTLGGMNTPIPPDLRPGPMTGLSNTPTGKEGGHD